MLTPDGRPLAPNERVRRWPWVSLNMRAEQLAEWRSLAKALGRSRADILREALEQAGLPYARAMARERATGALVARAPGARSGIGAAGDGATPAAGLPEGEEAEQDVA